MFNWFKTDSRTRTTAQLLGLIQPVLIRPSLELCNNSTRALKIKNNSLGSRKVWCNTLKSVLVYLCKPLHFYFSSKLIKRGVVYEILDLTYFSLQLFVFCSDKLWLANTHVNHYRTRDSLVLIGCVFLSIKMRSFDWAKSPLKPSPCIALNGWVARTPNRTPWILLLDGRVVNHAVLRCHWLLCQKWAVLVREYAFPRLSYAKQREESIARPETQTEYRYHFSDGGNSALRLIIHGTEAQYDPGTLMLKLAAVFRLFV